MELFLSWSKPRSHAMALLFRRWLPDVIQQVRPWMSSEDIAKGQRWAVEIGAKLDSGSQGIICITRENINSAWLNFEAGALAKSLAEGRVHPVLLDMKPAQVEGPLAQFQATEAYDKDEMRKLLEALNGQCSEPLESVRLARAIERSWPDFIAEIDQIPRSIEPSSEKPERPAEDILDELLERTREIQRTIVQAQAITQPGVSGIKSADSAYVDAVVRVLRDAGFMVLPGRRKPLIDFRAQARTKTFYFVVRRELSRDDLTTLRRFVEAREEYVVVFLRTETDVISLPDNITLLHWDGEEVETLKNRLEQTLWR